MLAETMLTTGNFLNDLDYSSKDLEELQLQIESLNLKWWTIFVEFSVAIAD